MATKTINWETGGGTFTVTYGGSGNGTIVVTSDDNTLHEARSQSLTIKTTKGGTVTKTITVAQAMKPYIDLTHAVVTAANQTYSGSALTPVPTVTLNGTTIPSTGYDVTYSNNTNAGIATITVTGKGDYTGTATGTFTIAKANPTYTAPVASTNLTYNGSSKYLTTAGSTSHGTIYYSINGTNWYTTRRTGTNAGTYTSYWKLTGDANHSDIASTSISTTIAQANGVAGVSSRSLTYNRSAQNLVTVSGNTGTVHYRLGTSGSWTTTIPTATNASTSYTVYYYVDASSDGNYKAVGSSSSPSYVTSSIAKVTPVLSTSPSLRTGLSYTGSAQNLLSGGAMKFSSSDSTSVSGTFTYTQQTNAGTYSNPTWTFTPSSTTNYNSTSGTVTGNVTIAQATGSVTTAPTNRGVTYSGSSQYIVTAGSGTGTMYYRYKLSTSSSWSSWSTTRPSRTTAGTYNIQYYCAASSDGNYTASATGSMNATIAKASRTISFSNPTTSVEPGSTVTNTATISAGSGDGTITYSSGNTSVATVNSSTGVVTGVANGSAVITASISEGTNYLSASTTYTIAVQASIINFDYTGAVQSATLGAGTYKLECWGAQGGSNAAASSYSITAKAGGKGGYSTGQLTLTSPTTVYVFVGGQGGSSGNGGWNGGGGGSGSSSYNSGNTNGVSRMGCGGGATDIALTTSTMSYSSYRTNRSSESLLSRIIVAGGGSGGAMCYKAVTTSTTTWPVIKSGNTSGNSHWKAGSNYLTSLSTQLTANESYIINFNGQTPNKIVFDADDGTSWVTLDWSSGTESNPWIPAKNWWVYLAWDDASHDGTFSIQRKTTSSSTSTDSDSKVGYVGGGTSGGGYSSTYQGRQSAAGTNGGFGYGANQTTTNYRYCSACGGGGWYGGGSGSASDSSMTNCKYSGGGSGFVNTSASSSSRPSGYTGLQLDSGTTYDGSQTFKAPSGSNETGHGGNGYARITRL